MREVCMDEWYLTCYAFDINKNLKERELFGRKIQFQSPQVCYFKFVSLMLLFFILKWLIEDLASGWFIEKIILSLKFYCFIKKKS